MKSSSGANAVQIVHSTRRRARDIEHLGSARTPAEVGVLKAAARERPAAGQGVLALELEVVSARGEVERLPAGPLPIRSSRLAHLGDALAVEYDAIGFDKAAGGDEVF